MEKFFRILKKIFDSIIEMLKEEVERQQKDNSRVLQKEKGYQRVSSESLVKYIKESSNPIEKRAAYNVYQERLQKYEDKHATKTLTMLEKIIKDENRDRAEREAAKNIYKRKK